MAKQQLSRVDALQTIFSEVQFIQEKETTTIKSIDTLFSSDAAKLDQVIFSSVLESLKAKPENTKREKIGFEHVEEEIAKRQTLKNKALQILESIEL
ncbi:hypothetical protein, partial, partial [Parasitella parasitica]